MAGSELERGQGHERGVRRLVKSLFQRAALLTPSLTRISTMVIVEEEIDLFHYFKIVDKYYYILVEVSSASTMWGSR